MGRTLGQSHSNGCLAGMYTQLEITAVFVMKIHIAL